MGGTQRLISADSHFKVSGDEIKEHLPAKFHAAYDRATREVDQPRDTAMHLRGGGGMALSSFQHEAARHPGYHDPVERLRAMDRDGVDAELLFSDLSAFRIFHRVVDGWKETARAFNDRGAEFAATDPERLLVSYQLPLVEIEYAVSELSRLVGDHHARAVHLPTKPTAIGLPDYHHERYDPLWGALSEMEIPVCIHLGVEDDLWDIAQRDPTPQMGVFTSQPAMRLSEQLGFLLLSGMLERFPLLRFVFVEPGLGWVPHYLEKLDQMATSGAYVFPAITELPSFYFHRQVSLTFMDEKRGVAMRHDIGVENIMWSTDFPHPACTWPGSRAVVDELMDGVPADEAFLMVYGNAARVFHL